MKVNKSLKMKYLLKYKIAMILNNKFKFQEIMKYGLILINKVNKY